MSFVPTFKLYAQNNTDLVYTFENIIPPILGWPDDNPSSISHTNLRSAGEIVVPEGNKPYDITLNGLLIADDYTALTTAIFSLYNTIAVNTKYHLHLDKSVSTYDDIKVMRKVPIIDARPTNRTRFYFYTIIFSALSWS